MSAQTDDVKKGAQALREALSKRAVVDVPVVSELYPDQPVADDAARKEAAALASGDLESEAAKREHGRTERFRDHVAVAILIVFWLGFLALVFAAIAWGINFILPTEKAILTPSQADRIISFLTGGGLTSFVANYAKKRLV